MFLSSKQMIACKQNRVLAVVVNCFSDSGLRRNQCCSFYSSQQSDGFITVCDESLIVVDPL